MTRGIRLCGSARRSGRESDMVDIGTKYRMMKMTSDKKNLYKDRVWSYLSYYSRRPIQTIEEPVVYI